MPPPGYNRSVKKLVAAAALLLAGCSRNIDNGAAVRQGVMDYLRARTAQTGLNVDQMDVEVTSVSFQKDEAHAVVNFRPKGVAQGGMQMNYTLDRKDNQWVVRGRSMNMANPHGVPDGSGSPTLPPDHPSSIAPDALPPGHPSTGAPPSGALPPGHPPVGSKQ